MNKSYCIIYNPLSNCNNTEKSLNQISALLKDFSRRSVDITTISSYPDFFNSLDGNEDLVISGGDGTLNRFINEANPLKYGKKILYFPSGTGNDFARDITFEKSSCSKNSPCTLIEINDYLKNLPTVTVNGFTKKFLNGIGYGIDGYCSKTGEELRQKGRKNINYTQIAIKGMLFFYKATDASVTVDGTTCEFKNVWLAPTMHGRFFGGGMMPAPEQKRGSEKLSCMIWTGKSRLQTLALFPKIFKGEHIKNSRHVKIMTGKTITVSFKRSVALQIDGEVVPDVKSYTVTI